MQADNDNLPKTPEPFGVVHNPDGGDIYEYALGHIGAEAFNAIRNEHVLGDPIEESELNHMWLEVSADEPPSYIFCEEEVPGSYAVTVVLP